MWLTKYRKWKCSSGKSFDCEHIFKKKLRHKGEIPIVCGSLLTTLLIREKYGMVDILYYIYIK